ncbi:SMI1/KNR4 family protein [Kitasatospora indigofera]|uniref:SMI1/KNR4 family protein n=1 Tax=Kitasatospora indigofera TaxID=67307 RepID=UPI0036BC5199
MTTIDDLIRLVEPPANPVHGNGDWAQAEAALGLGLPADFKALVERYGFGQFVGFISPLTPFGGRNLLVEQAQGLLDGERSFRRRNPEKCPYPFHPEPGGLLPWAGVDSGARLCWLTDGEPDSWTVVAWSPRSWYYEAHDVGAVGFLHGLLSGRITTEAFSLEDEDEQLPPPSFEPAWR